MTPREAIEQAHGRWFRPVCLRGSGKAFEPRGQEGAVLWWTHVPAVPVMMFVEYMCCDWEIVDPATVLAEREHD